MKRVVGTILCLVMLGLSVSVSAYTVTMHSLDGRTIQVNDWEVEGYRRVNWYNGVPVTIYALDGRTLTIGENDISMYENVGWYRKQPVKVYAYTGDSNLVKEQIISFDELEATLNVGWYRTYSEALYTAIVAETKKAMNVGDYGKVIQLVADCKASLEYPYNDWVCSIADDAAHRWQNAAGCPLVVYEQHVDTSGYSPYLRAKFINLSKKTISAFKLDFRCYNAFGEPCLYNRSNLFDGWYDVGTVPAYRDCKDFSNTLKSIWWDLYQFPRAKYVRDIKIKEIMYIDGTRWRR